MVNQARWQPHVCLRPLGGWTEVKEQICDTQPHSLPPSVAPLHSLLFFLFYFCFIFMFFFSFYLSFLSPRSKVKHPSATDYRKQQHSKYFTSDFPLYIWVSMQFRACLKHFWSQINDDMFCAYFQTLFFCNANGCDSVNKKKGRHMLNGSPETLVVRSFDFCEGL